MLLQHTGQAGPIHSTMALSRFRTGSLMRSIWFYALALLCSLSLTAQACDSGTLYLMRHAEKSAQGGSDPALSAQGEARAQALVEKFSQQAIAAVFSTDYQRTRATATPLAKARQLDVILYNPDQPAQLLQRLAQDYCGKHVVIVGHSNTVPELIKLAGISQPVVIAETAFGDIYQLQRSPHGNRLSLFN
ncbi:phosphoglycerate mutase [Chitinimonas prasina]|uniref:Phosphoglycerate mutase n=1 Tax=Chitinimonas prasina TaxID=1434937 RepID=A0ABQ5YD41_9NEIS|nr:phosphoglycerate mutase family protein [Chitinimonas prasina]GLR11913.1 phosphoglycerate mutase [Chitinimonas prasina]